MNFIVILKDFLKNNLEILKYSLYNVKNIAYVLLKFLNEETDNKNK